MKLKLDLQKCIVAGECYYNHPRIIGRDDESGCPEVLVEDLLNDDDIREAHEAAEVCPAQAITVEE
jgi:ferredoxin